MRAAAVGALFLLVGSACGGHDGPVASGGTDAGLPVLWQDLYAAYFGPSGQASCSQMPGSCHRAASDLGVATSGFVCGTTSDQCWQGMMQGQLGHVGIVPMGGTADATKTLLWAALYKGAPSGGAAGNNMPQNLKYTFSTTDLALISAWIESGAPNN